MEEAAANEFALSSRPLVAFPVGAEDETSVVDASEQHHSPGWAPIGRGRGNVPCPVYSRRSDHLRGEATISLAPNAARWTYRWALP